MNLRAFLGRGFSLQGLGVLLKEVNSGERVGVVEEMG